jgi:serine/threonine protein kinase
MELVKGGDLFDRIIDKGKYSESEAREVMKMLLEAVKYLHSKGIVHRDLKPENILLVDNSTNSQVCSYLLTGSSHGWQIKISDFGLAKQASREGLRTFCGTPQYFAPEVLGQRHPLTENNSNQDLEFNRGYNFKADMWSVGVVLFIMLSGVFPFDEDSLFDQVLYSSFHHFLTLHSFVRQSIV